MVCVCFSPGSSPASGPRRVGDLCELQVLLTELGLPRSSWATRTAPPLAGSGAHAPWGFGAASRYAVSVGKAPAVEVAGSTPGAFARLGGLPGLQSSWVLSGPGSPAAGAQTMDGPGRAWKAPEGQAGPLRALCQWVEDSLASAPGSPGPSLSAGVRSCLLCPFPFGLPSHPRVVVHGCGALPARPQRRPPGPSRLLTAE